MGYCWEKYVLEIVSPMRSVPFDYFCSTGEDKDQYSELVLSAH